MNISSLHYRDNFSLLIDFTCATAKDELEKHPEMRTIAMVELENNFPSKFSREVLKCLPKDVAKVVINPHIHTELNNTMSLPKQMFVIYIADKVEKNQTFINKPDYFEFNIAGIHPAAKRLIVSKKPTNIKITSQWIFEKLLNVVQIYEENHKVIARSFDMTRNLSTFETFESSQRENLSQILFPDKTKNLNGQTLYAVYTWDIDAFEREETVNCKWTPYLEIITKELNATVKFTEIPANRTSWAAFSANFLSWVKLLAVSGKLDFYLNTLYKILELQSYKFEDYCLLAPVPEPYSITELILLKPLDKSCWMWLGITIAVSTLIWRISEGHWNFAFGAFSYFMGQAQLSVRIRTNRLMMKILLQILIISIFIFSNGYQSLVTSFMLNPLQQKFLKTVEEVLDSDLYIALNENFDLLYKDHPKYQKAKSDGRVKFFLQRKPGSTYDKFEGLKMVDVNSCRFIKRAIELDGDGKTTGGYYLVPDVIASQQQDLYTRPFHPYLEKFQKIMDRTFEFGLHQAWEATYWRNLEKGIRKEHKNKNLDFDLIVPFFLILAFGFFVALFALLCEIFWRDFVMQLSREYFRRKWNEIIGRRRVNRVRVRRIQITPASRSNPVILYN